MHNRALQRAANERGAALIEFAVVVPVLLLLVFGMMRFGIAYNNQIILTDSVRDGARMLSVSRGDNTDICNKAGLKVRNAAVTLDPTKITMTMLVAGSSNTAAAGALPSCNGAGTSAAFSSGSDVTMTATYPCSLQVMGITFGPSTCRLTSSTTARVE